MRCINRRTALKVGAMSAAGLAARSVVPMARTRVASDQYSSVVLAKGPVGYWRLGEAEGPTAFDASGNGYDGISMGNPTFGEPGAIANDPDTAIGVNGPTSMDYVEIADPDSQAFSQPTSGLGLTVEVWIRPDAVSYTHLTLPTILLV